MDKKRLSNPTQAIEPFSLARLLRTCFAPRPGEKIAVLIDLEDPSQMKDLLFLKRPELTVQRLAYEVFYLGLERGVARELSLGEVGFYCYHATGGSNLDLPDLAMNPQGEALSLERDLYPWYNIFLCLSTYSATAPLTAFAKRFGFRGATMHGLNETILRTGLAVDYNLVSQNAEKLRLGMTRADWAQVEFTCLGNAYTLRLELSRQEAQKSHGLCRGEKPDIANLPAGEIYWVPTGGEGSFPQKFDDGTIGLMNVRGGRVVEVTGLSGNPATIEARQRRIQEDPMTGVLGELGLGTQMLPPSGRDIQDEKILGTFHLATGRDDHLGGSLTPDKFVHARNATHDDILFAPHKTPEITSVKLQLRRGNDSLLVVENYQPSDYVRQLLAGGPTA